MFRTPNLPSSLDFCLVSKMKAVVLDGSRTENGTLNLPDIIAAGVERYGYDVEIISLRDEKIGSCTGCFGCWLRTPGMCLIDDDGRKVAGEIIRSNLAVFVTPVTFGGYSSELKKAVDRVACPSLLPFLVNIGGEVHHPGRYERSPTLVAFGVLPRPDTQGEGLFKALVGRNAINMHTHGYSAMVYSTDSLEAIRSRVDSLLDEAGVPH